MQKRKYILLALLLAIAVLPLAGNVGGYWLHVLNLTWIASIAALGVTIATGMTGQIVLGQAGKEFHHLGGGLPVGLILDRVAIAGRIGGHVVLKRHRDVDDLARHIALTDV